MAKKIFIVCSGLGRVNRGFESFSRGLFDTLNAYPGYDFFLVKGAGQKHDREIVIKSPFRYNKTVILISKIIGIQPYTLEQFFFVFLSLKVILRYKPSLIIFSDFQLGTFLWHYRRLLKLEYLLLFSNGAPNGPPFLRTDFIHQLLPSYLEAAVEGGFPRSRQYLIPYGIEVEASTQSRKFDRIKIREQLGLPNKKIIISVGALNESHKRMLTLIKEYFCLSNRGEYCLVLLGQRDIETKQIDDEVNVLGLTNEIILKQVPQEFVKQFLLAADFFVLASLNEGLPRVLPEALSCGLVPIVHDYDVTRQTLHEYGHFVDMRLKGFLENGLRLAKTDNIDIHSAIAFCTRTYSWTSLRPLYLKMIESCTV